MLFIYSFALFWSHFFVLLPCRFAFVLFHFRSLCRIRFRFHCARALRPLSCPLSRGFARKVFVSFFQCVKRSPFHFHTLAPVSTSFVVVYFHIVKHEYPIRLSCAYFATTFMSNVVKPTFAIYFFGFGEWFLFFIFPHIFFFLFPFVWSLLLVLFLLFAFFLCSPPLSSLLRSILHWFRSERCLGNK